jgi:hypothetical protein
MNFHDFDPYDAMTNMNHNIQVLTHAHNVSQSQIDLLLRQVQIQQTQLLDLRRDLLKSQLNNSEHSK